MVLQCSVLGCNNKFVKGQGVKFHRFPQNNIIRKKWVVCCGKKSIIETSRICCVHFEPECYNPSGQLKYNSAPTLLLPSKEIINQQQQISENGRNLQKGQSSSKQIQTEGDLNCSLWLENQKLKKELQQLRSENKIYKSSLERVELQNEQLKQSFFDVSFYCRTNKKMENKAVRQKWTKDDISSALSMYTAGSRLYKMMYRKNFPLRTPRTLRKWCTKVSLKPGILKTTIRLMQSANLNIRQKLCVLSFDKMSVKSTYEYDRVNDEIITSVNYVQVVMARGLMSKWKQVVFYEYDCPITTKILFEIIKELYKINCTVVAIVCDMGGSNQKLWKHLNIGILKTWFNHPSDNEKKIFVFADAPHLLKLVRNHFLDDEMILNDKVFSAKPIRELVYKLRCDDLRITHKVCDKHLTVQGPVRQNVKLAAQLMSHSVSCALKRAYELGHLEGENVVECADFVKIINDWFDVFNSKIPTLDSRSRIRHMVLILIFKILFWIK